MPLNERQIQIIRFVEQQERCLIADVAKHLKLESGPVRSSIKILVRDGYLATKTIKGLAEPTLSMGQRYHVQKFVEIRLGKKRITK